MIAVEMDASLDDTCTANSKELVHFIFAVDWLLPQLYVILVEALEMAEYSKFELAETKQLCRSTNL